MSAPLPRIGLLAWIAVAVFAAPAQATLLSFSFDDPVGDQSGPPGAFPGIDVTRLDFVFDDVSGAYQITLTATEEAPFLTSFRVNVNLYNVDAGPAAFPSFFTDNQNDFVLSLPQSTLTLGGVAPLLRFWNRGDRIASSSAPFGAPNTVFAFSVGIQGNTPPWGDFLSNPGFDTALVVPEPGGAGLVALGLAGLAGWRRRSGGRG